MMADISAFQGFYNPSTAYTSPRMAPLGWDLADNATARATNLIDFNTAQGRRTKDFTRGQNDLVDRFSNQGAARSGALGVQSGRMLQDYNDANSEAQVLLRRQQDALDVARQRATIGQLSG